MNLLKSLFPVSCGANSVKGLIIAIIIYVVVNLVGGFVLGLLGAFPLIGFVFDFVGKIIWAYCALGVIVALLIFFKIVK